MNTMQPEAPKICCTDVTESCTNTDTSIAYIFIHMMLFTKEIYFLSFILGTGHIYHLIDCREYEG